MDSWAIANIGLVKAIDGFTATPEEVRKIAFAGAQIAVKQQSNPCLAPHILAQIRSKTPERDVLTVQLSSGETQPDVHPVAFYGDSYVCLAHLGPVQKAALDQRLWGVFPGGSMEYWKYPVYADPKGGDDVVKLAAFRQMASAAADGFAEAVAAAKMH